MAEQSVRDYQRTVYKTLTEGGTLAGVVSTAPSPPSSLQINSRTAFGDLTAPTAGTAIATLSAIPSGTWDITCYTNLAGSAAANDRPNIALKVGASQVTTLLSTMNGYNDIFSIRVNLATATDVSVNAISNATAGAVYRASLVATRFA